MGQRQEREGKRLQSQKSSSAITSACSAASIAVATSFNLPEMSSIAARTSSSLEPSPSFRADLGAHQVNEVNAPADALPMNANLSAAQNAKPLCSKIGTPYLPRNSASQSTPAAGEHPTMNTPKSSESATSTVQNLCSIWWPTYSAVATDRAPSGAGASIVNPNTFAPSAYDHMLSARSAPHTKNFIGNPSSEHDGRVDHCSRWCELCELASTVRVRFAVVQFADSLSGTVRLVWRKEVGPVIDVDVSEDDAIGVIQCAGTKRFDAGHFVGDDGRKVMFVADPALAPTSQSLRYARPDDETPAGHTYRERLEQYNRDNRTDNPWGLLPAWRLYARPAYRTLVEALGVDNVFILSAGWGLVPADYLLPLYDITFSSNASAYKRRRSRDKHYRDYSMLPQDTAKHVFFFGSKDYLALFCARTAKIRRRTVFVRSKGLPRIDCRIVRYETTNMRTWHYECVDDFVAKVRGHG